MINASKKYGRLTVETSNAAIKANVIDKIQTCLEANEPFGLQSMDSVIVVLPKECAAAWYDKDLKKTVHQFKSRDAVDVFLSTILFTHDSFIGPLGVHKFLIAVKVIEDAKPRIQLL
jgi:hypothetical protein